MSFGQPCWGLKSMRMTTIDVTRVAAGALDEQVWENVKTRVARRTPQNKVKLKILLTSVLRRPHKLPHLVRGFFRHAECQYAAM